MIDERDPAIQALFDDAKQATRGDTFVADVMSQVNASRRRALYAWGAVALVLLVAAALLTGPITEAVSLMTRVIPQPLVETGIGDALVTELLAPLNSVAAVVGVGGLLLVMAYRKLFGCG